MSVAVEPTVDEPVEMIANRVPIQIGDKKVFVGRLSINQLLGVGRVLAKIFEAVSSDQAKSIVTAAKAGIGATQSPATPVKSRAKKGVPASATPEPPAPESKNLSWSTILDLVDETSVGSLLALITREPADWCLDNVDLVSIGHMAEAILDYNEVDTLKRVFRRATGSDTPETSKKSSRARS